VPITRATRFRLLKPPKGDNFWPALWQALDETQRAANEIMTELYLHQKRRYDYYREHKEWPDEEKIERFVKYRNFSQRYRLNSRILAMLYPQHPHNPSRGGGFVGGIWKRLGRDVMSGKASLPNIRWGRIPFKAIAVLDKNKVVRIEERDGDLWWPLPLGETINLRSGRGWYWIRLATRTLDGSRRSILKHLRDGTYRCGDWELRWDARRRFLELVVTYTAPEEEQVELDASKALGIDLGVKQTVAAVTDSPYPVGRAALRESTSQLIQTKLRIEARRREVQRRLNRPDVRRGHGRKAKFRGMEALDRKWNSFRHTWNHTLSRRIVDLAVSEGCGVIRMEDLHGKLTDTQTFLGRNWPLHELWEMVKYKAVEAGVETEFINPAFTSRRCHNCGHINNDFSFEFRKKGNWPDFNCPACGWSGDADFNAAKNIANPEVVDAIKRQLVKQGLRNPGNGKE